VICAKIVDVLSITSYLSSAVMWLYWH